MHKQIKRTLEPRGVPTRGERYLEEERKGPARFANAMTFLRSLSALLLALNTAAAQGSSSQPSFFLQDPSDGKFFVICVPSKRLVFP